MLMERFGLDSEASFNVLRRLSSHRNQKLREVAEQLVTTRALPDSTALLAARIAEPEARDG